MKNNTKNSPKTNLIGYILLGTGILIFILSIFSEVKLDLSEYGGIFGLIAAGVLFLLGMSDEALLILKLNKSSNQTESTMAYEETTRTTGFLTDGTEVEVFSWREESTDPYTDEVQLIENDASSSTGIWVYWNSNTSNYIGQTTAQFKAASFPRKPIKRGGTPPSA